MVASQELKAGDLLRRFKAEVSQDEPRRGNNTNRHTSARRLEIMTVYGILLTFFGVFMKLDGTCACVCVYWCVALFLAMLFIFIQGKGICLLVVGSSNWKRGQ